MAQSSLITTSEIVKKALIVFAVFAGIVLLGQLCISMIGGFGKGPIVVGGSSDYLNADSGLGALLPLPISNLKISSQFKPEYEQDNKLASLPYNAINVYQIDEPREKFDLEQNANTVAEKLGFSSAPQRKTENGQEVLLWNDKGRILQVNKISQEWKYFNPLLIPASNANKFYTDETKYKNSAGSIINLLSLPIKLIDSNTTEVDYLVRKGNSYVSAFSPGSADYLKLKVYRTLEAATPKINIQVKPLDAQTISDDFLSAPLEIVISTSQPDQIKAENIVSFHFFNWELTAQKGVYDIITTQQAWDKVKSGEGALKELVEEGFNRYEYGQLTNQEVLRFTADYQQVSLAYLEPPSWSKTRNYFYPVYVFKGRARLSDSPDQDNAEFTIFVPALKFTPVSPTPKAS